MDILDKREHYIILFDFYGCLLTEKQKRYFEAYFFEDLSLSEIADEYNVSRNAIFDQLTKVYKTLEKYEKKLCLKEKYEKANSIFEEYEKLNNNEIKEMIKKLKDIE